MWMEQNEIEQNGREELLNLTTEAETAPRYV